jgi:hypothetical protein
MNLVVATIPDDPADLAPWLERRLVGLELDGLVAELAAIHGPTPGRPTLRDVLNDRLDQVRLSGLSCLTRDQLRQLLTRPTLLLELQEDVLCSGGSYWDQIARTLPVMHLKVEEGRKRLPSPVTNAPTSPRTAPAPQKSVSPWYKQAWFVSLATAAAVLVAVGVWTWSRPGPVAKQTAWGWDRPGAIKEDATASEYLNGLAKAGDEWFNKRPDDAEGLARRIGEMRQGCSALIRAPHRPLAEKDRQWLVERCKAWSKDFDVALAALDDGQDPAEVREKMDETVNKLSKALRGRATASSDKVTG